MPRQDISSPRGAWVYYLLLLGLALLPLPFGAFYQWSWAGLGVLVATVALVSLLLNLPNRFPLQVYYKPLWLPALLYLSVVAWLAVQASGLTPDSWGHAIWRQSAEVLGGSYSAPISLNPYATRSELLKLLTYAGVFWLAVLYGRDRERARTGLWLIGIVGALYAVYGLAAHFTEFGETLWRRKMPSATVSSVFVNRNLYADYAAFGFLAVFGLILDAWLSRSNSKHEGIAFWQRLLGGKESHFLLLLVLGLVILAALTLTGSRGGILSAAIASLALFLLLVRGQESKPGNSRQKISIGLVVLGAWLVVYVVAGAPLGSRLAETTPESWAGRLDSYRMLLPAIGAAPLTGYGAGNSYNVFYLFNDGSLWRALNYANLYLDAAVNLGIPAAILLIASVGLVVLSCFRGVRLRRRDQVFPALGVAVSLHVVLHGFVDSPFYLAANAATFSFLMGLAYAQAWPSRRP